MNRTGFPVRIRGITYPSQRAAARALGVCDATVRKALDAGRIDEVGLNIRRGGHPGTPCLYRGKAYPSRAAAAKACGVTKAAVSKAAKASTEAETWSIAA